MINNNTGIKFESGLKEKITSIIILVLVLLTIWQILDIVLLTFILTFVFYQVLKLIRKIENRIFPHRLPDGLVITLLYVIFIVFSTVIIILLAPVLTKQFTDIAAAFSKFDFQAFVNALNPRVAQALGYIDFNKYIADAGIWLASIIAKVGGLGVSLFIAMILSLLILLERSKISEFGKRIKNSRMAFLYDYVTIFGGNFVDTFGKVMKVQVMTAFITALVSTIFLSILSFPQVIGLGFMIFLMDFIPVVGVFISLVPLIIIGFTFGGIIKVIEVIVMIFVIHTLEAYVLSPRLMSRAIKLPVVIILIILIVGEHYLGIWGLLIGIPIFLFVLNEFNVDLVADTKTHNRNAKTIKDK